MESNILDLGDLSGEERVDVALVYGGGLLIGIGSLVLRVQAGRPTGGLDSSLFAAQYAIAYIFLGAMVLLRTRVRTPGGAFFTTGVSIATFLGLLLPAYGVTLVDIISYALLGALVLFGGILHYQVNRPTNAQAIVFASVLFFELWLYGVIYLLAAFLQVGNPLLLVGLAVLIGILYGVFRIMIREYQYSYSEFLDPLLNKLSS